MSSYYGTAGGHVEIKGRYNRAVSKTCREAAGAMWRIFREAPPMTLRAGQAVRP